MESDASWFGILNGMVWVGAALPQGLRIMKGQALEPDLCDPPEYLRPGGSGLAFHSLNLHSLNLVLGACQTQLI